MEHESIDINIIKPDPKQPRKSFDKVELDQLAQSIIVHGVLQSIVVKKEANEYIIVAGERRYRACQIAGLKEIPCHITKSGNHKEIALIENLQRVDLNPIEEAEAIKELMLINSYNQREVAGVLGKTRSYVANKLRLLGLDRDIKARFYHDLNEGNARAILSLKNKAEQRMLYEEIIAKGLTVRESEKRAKEISMKKERTLTEKKQTQAPKDKYLAKALENLEEKLCTRVKLQKGTKSSALVIEYHTQEDLEQLIESLLEG